MSKIKIAFIGEKAETTKSPEIYDKLTGGKFYVECFKHLYQFRPCRRDFEYAVVSNPYKRNFISMSIVAVDPFMPVNVLKRDGNLWDGYNTDGRAFVQTFRNREVLGKSYFLLVGNGAMAQTIKSLVPAMIVNSEDWSENKRTIDGWADIHEYQVRPYVVNCTPVHGFVEEDDRYKLIDLNYDPDEKPFSDDPSFAMEMLINQCKLNLDLWGIKYGKEGERNEIRRLR